MAIKKNRIHLMDKYLSMDLEDGVDYYYYHRYDWNGNDWKSERDDNECLNYKYIKPDIVMNVRKCTNSFSRYNIGFYEYISVRMIDMDSIYSKEMMRDKKIDKILGLSTTTPTFGDIIQKSLKK